MDRVSKPGFTLKKLSCRISLGIFIFKCGVIFCLIFLLNNPLKAQRLSLSFDYQYNFIHSAYRSDSFVSKITDKTYRRYKDEVVNTNGDTLKNDIDASFSFGITLGLYKRHWHIETGIIGELNAIDLFLKPEVSNEDLVQVGFSRLALKIPFRIQYIFFSNKVRPFVELGMSYLLHQNISRESLTEFVLDGLSLERKGEVLEDMLIASNYENLSTEYTIGLGIQIKNKWKLILRDSFYINPNEAWIKQFHFIGLGLNFDLSGGKLMRKRKSIYGN